MHVQIRKKAISGVVHASSASMLTAAQPVFIELDFTFEMNKFWITVAEIYNRRCQELNDHYIPVHVSAIADVPQRASD